MKQLLIMVLMTIPLAIIAQDTLSVTSPVAPDVADPMTYTISWVSIICWVLGLLIHLLIKISKTEAPTNSDKVSVFMSKNLFKVLISVACAVAGMVLLISIIDAINHSRVELTKLPEWIVDYGNLLMGGICFMIGFGNSSLILWLTGVAKRKAKVNYSDDDDIPTQPAGGLV